MNLTKFEGLLPPFKEALKGALLEEDPHPEVVIIPHGGTKNTWSVVITMDWTTEMYLIWTCPIEGPSWHKVS